MSLTRPTGPFRRMAVLGDSIAYGMCAARPEREWAQVAANLLRQFQDEPLRVMNRALPAAVISPRCPGYEESAKPSLIEHHQRHAIETAPDIIIIAEGLNDMRSGMPIKAFSEDLETIVIDIQRETQALVVLVGIYHQKFGCGANDPAELPIWTQWNPDLAWLYNEAISQTATKHNTLFVDALAVLGGANWVLNPDCCHLNDLGHVLIGNAVFQTIATAYPGMAATTLKAIEANKISVTNTGGADTDEQIQAWWQAAAARFGVEL